jgi:RimJ/RimL family protein N-acetyltransferase
MSGDLLTPRLCLRPCTVELLRAELEGEDALRAALGADVPAQQWPPGEHTLDAVRYYLDHPQLLRGDWADYYVLTQARPGSRATLVASIGYQAPPNPAGRVEVGYSVVESWRRRGVATEAVAALVRRAAAAGLRAVVAHALPDNAASIAVLRKSGFRPSLSTRDGQLGFERKLYQLRRASAGELAAVNEIYASVAFSSSTANDLQLVAEADGAFVGLARIVRLPRDPDSRSDVALELGGVWVAPHLRGAGTARAMVEALLAAAGGQPLACIPFAHLQAFYASCGFALWQRGEIPSALQQKLTFCASAYRDPVVLMIHRR